MEAKRFYTFTDILMPDNIVNINSMSENETERTLSNLANTPFMLFDTRYQSVESLWMSIYFPEGSQERNLIPSIPGRQANREGKKRSPDLREISWQGETILIGSPEHHEIMRVANRAKYEQNPDALALLLATGNKKMTHVIYDRNGNLIPDSKSIPGVVLSRILMELREEFRRNDTKEIILFPSF